MFGKKKDPAIEAAEKEAKAERKAQAKADKAAGKAAKKELEAAEALQDKDAKKAEKAVKAADKQSSKAAENTVKAVPKGLIGTLTDPKAARRLVAVGKLLGPVVAPVALRASTEIRGKLDERKAAKLGVSAAEVSSFRGPTGPAAARIATLQTSIDELKRRRSGDLQVTRFAEVAKTRLADLSTALRATASMPSGRRRSTLHAVNKDLNQIDADLMTYLIGTAA